MPTIEVTICRLPETERRQLIEDLTGVFVSPEIPPEWVTIVFRHIEPGDFVRGGRLPLFEGTWDGHPDEYAPEPLRGPGLVDITCGDLDQAAKRQIARGVAESLVRAGVPDDLVSIHFRHVTGRDVAGAGGEFPFRPAGSDW